MVWNLKQEKPQRQRRCSTHDVIETISTFAIKARTHGNVFMRFCIVSSNELVVSIPLRIVNNTKTQENVSVHIKETEISQKQSKGIKNWKITYSVILRDKLDFKVQFPFNDDERLHWASPLKKAPHVQDRTSTVPSIVTLLMITLRI